MFIHSDIAKQILSELIKAEERQEPLTLDEAMEKWGGGSTWEDLVDYRFVVRNSTATASPRGRKWYEQQVLYDQVSQRTDWEQITEEIRVLLSRLREKPHKLKFSYQFNPGSILNAFSGGDLNFDEAVSELEKWKDLQMQ